MRDFTEQLCKLCSKFIWVLSFESLLLKALDPVNSVFDGSRSCQPLTTVHAVLLQLK